MTSTVTRTLSEHESKRLLAAASVPVLDERVVATPDAAVDAAREVAPGRAVVAKLCGDGMTHKTERGLVRLGLHGDDDVSAASAALLGAATPEDGPVGVLVTPMVRGSRELIAGVYRDDQFGPSVMLGVGGVLAEALADVAFRLVPVERVDAEEMLDDLQMQAITNNNTIVALGVTDRERIVAVLTNRLAGFVELRSVLVTQLKQHYEREAQVRRLRLDRERLRREHESLG